MSLSLFIWYYSACSISGHINLNPRVSSTRAKVPLHVLSMFIYLFMWACSGQEWMWALGLARRWPMVEITKKAVIHTHTFFFPQGHWLLQSPDCCCVPSWRRWGRMHIHSLLATPQQWWFQSLPLSWDPSPRTSYHRGDIISFATTVLIGDEITCSHNALPM